MVEMTHRPRQQDCEDPYPNAAEHLQSPGRVQKQGFIAAGTLNDAVA